MRSKSIWVAERTGKDFLPGRTASEFRPRWKKGAFGGRDSTRRVASRVLATDLPPGDRQAMEPVTAHLQGLRPRRCRTAARGSRFQARLVKTPVRSCRANAAIPGSP